MHLKRLFLKFHEKALLVKIKKEYQNNNKKKIEDAIKFLDDAEVLRFSKDILKAQLFKRQKGEYIINTILRKIEI